MRCSLRRGGVCGAAGNARLSLCPPVQPGLCWHWQVHSGVRHSRQPAAHKTLSTSLYTHTRITHILFTPRCPRRPRPHWPQCWLWRSMTSWTAPCAASSASCWRTRASPTSRSTGGRGAGQADGLATLGMCTSIMIPGWGLLAAPQKVWGRGARWRWFWWCHRASLPSAVRLEAWIAAGLSMRRPGIMICGSFLLQGGDHSGIQHWLHGAA